MARKKESPRGPIGIAIYQLRTGLRERQKPFADRLRVSISTLVRFEGDHVPPAKFLVRLQQIAQEKGREDLAQVFAKAIADQAGTPQEMNLSSDKLSPKTAEEKCFVRALLFCLRAPEENVENEKAALKRVLGPIIIFLDEEDQEREIRAVAVLQLRDALQKGTALEKLVRIYQIRQIADVLFNYDPDERLIDSYADEVIVHLLKEGLTPDEMPRLYNFSRDAATVLAKKNRMVKRSGSRRSQKSTTK